MNLFIHIMKRRHAASIGLRHYFTGKPCAHGHFDLRFTSTGQCCECMRIISSSKEKKEYDREYQNKNAGKILKRRRVYRVKNKDKIKQKSDIWIYKNKDRVQAIKHTYKIKRRAKEASGVSSSELADWSSKQDKICYWCGDNCADNYHIDHYEPLSKGGTHEIENLVIACQTCNLRKNAKDPYEFAQEKGKLF